MKTHEADIIPWYHSDCSLKRLPLSAVTNTLLLSFFLTDKKCIQLHLNAMLTSCFSQETPGAKFGNSTECGLSTSRPLSVFRMYLSYCVHAVTCLNVPDHCL